MRGRARAGRVVSEDGRASVATAWPGPRPTQKFMDPAQLGPEALVVHSPTDSGKEMTKLSLQR